MSLRDGLSSVSCGVHEVFRKQSEGGFCVFFMRLVAAVVDATSELLVQVAEEFSQDCDPCVRGNPRASRSSTRSRKGCARVLSNEFGCAEIHEQLIEINNELRQRPYRTVHHFDQDTATNEILLCWRIRARHRSVRERARDDRQHKILFPR